MALFLALVLLGAAAHKAMQRERLTHAIARLIGLTAPMAALVLVLAGVLEGLAALALLVPATQSAGAAGAAGLWALYALALLRRRGAVLDCGCDLQQREQPVSTATIARPGLLSALALACALMPGAGWSIETPFAAAALVALWFAASELAALPARQHRHGRASS